MAKDYSAMTPNERLFDAGLLDEYDRVRATGNLDAINDLLAKVDLKFVNGSHWDVVKKPTSASELGNRPRSKRNWW